MLVIRREQMFDRAVDSEVARMKTEEPGNEDNKEQDELWFINNQSEDPLHRLTPLGQPSAVKT